MSTFKSMLFNDYKVIERQFNMTSLYGPTFPSGKFMVPIKDREKFLDIYFQYVFVNNQNCHLLEVPFKESNQPQDGSLLKNANVIKIDLDFRFTPTDIELNNNKPIRNYKLKHIKKIIKKYITTLENYIEIPDDFTVFIMEKENATITEKNGKYIKKDGVHIMIPEYLVPDCILKIVRRSLIEDEELIDMFKKIKCTNKIDDIIDECVICTNNWFLYGSGKPNDYVYKVTKAYDIKFNDYEEYYEENVEESTTSKNLFNLEEIGIPTNKILVKILSNLFVSKNITLKSQHQELANLLENDIQSNKNYNNISTLDLRSELSRINHNNIKKPMSDHFTITYLDCLMNCFDKKRAENYNDWHNIAQALYNVDYRNYEIFKKFSQKCPDKYNEQACKDEWYKVANYSTQYHSLKINYIRKLAEQDNPNEYNTVQKKFGIQLLNEILVEWMDSRHEKGFACATFSKLTKKFIDSYDELNLACVHEDSHIYWFYFENHRWHEDKGGIKIDKFLMNKFLETFLNASTKFLDLANQTNQTIMTASLQNNNIQDNNNDSDNENSDIFTDNRSQNNINLSHNKDELMSNYTEFEKKSKAARKIACHLEESTKKNNIKKNLATLYNDPEFYEKLDIQTHIFVCKNGVIDLNNCVFRNGRLEDMMMRYSDIEFIDDDIIQKNPELYALQGELQDFIDKLFPDYELQEYALDLVAECLDGEVKRQEMFVCSGSGSNGKSKWENLLKATFGNYYRNMQISVLTRKRNDPNQASPAIASLRGGRIIGCEEPDDNSAFSTSFMKELTGGGFISARELHKPLINFKIQGKIFLYCNDKPNIESTDDGTRRRIKCIPYVSKFVAQGDARLNDKNTYPNHFERDEQIEDKIKTWAPLFLNMLFNRYKILKQKKFIIETPDVARAAINEYLESANMFNAFIQDKMRKEVGESCSVDDAFNAFKIWADESNVTYNNITKHVFQKNISRLIQEKDGKRKWKDWCLVIDNGFQSENDSSDSDEE